MLRIFVQIEDLMPNKVNRRKETNHKISFGILAGCMMKLFMWINIPRNHIENTLEYASSSEDGLCVAQFIPFPVRNSICAVLGIFGYDV